MKLLSIVASSVTVNDDSVVTDMGEGEGGQAGRKEGRRRRRKRRVKDKEVCSVQELTHGSFNIEIFARPTFYAIHEEDEILEQQLKGIRIVRKSLPTAYEGTDQGSLSTGGRSQRCEIASLGLMRRSQTEAIRRDDPNANRLLMTRASQESRWDPTKYDPIQVYGELAELFSKLRSDLGPDIQKYLLLVKRYVKQSLSVYELEKKVTKLLKAESMSSHDTFIQKLSESCHLVPFSRSLDDILDGNMGGNESQKGYMPHISTINALLMLRSLENGWAAPDASAGQLIGEAVKTMISDRIDAALHVRRSPSKNQIGFRSSFNPSRYSAYELLDSDAKMCSEISEARLGNAFHEVTLADLFSSFSVESHFLGAETHKLLQLKCHSNFYEKLKSVVEGRQENTTRQSTLERSDIAYCLNSKSTEKKEFSDPNAKQIYSPWLSEPSPKKESVRKIEKLKYNTDISLESDFNMDELSNNLQDWPGRRNEKESKRKTESQNPSARRALFSSESEVPSFVLGKSSKSTARSGRVAVIDKKRNQTAQAIIDAWKSSSYEIVPTYVDEQSSFEREGRMNISRNRALTSALPSYHDDKHEDLIASRKTSPKRTSMEAKSSLPDVLSLSNKESGGKAEKYKSSVPLSFENSFILQDTTKAGAYSHSSPQEGKEAPFTNLVARKKASIDRSFGSYESPVGAHSENACTSISMPSSSQEQTVLISPPEQLKKRKPSVKFSTLSSATQESNSRESRLIDVHMEETLSTSQSTDTITDIQESMALPESARVEKESQISLDFKSDSKGKKEKKFEQFSKSRKSLQKVRKMRSNRQQYDTHINETRDDYQQPYPLEIHVGEDVPSKMVSKRMPKDKHASARTAPILRSLSQSSADNESQPVAVIKRNRKRSRGRQGGARVNKTTLTLRSSSQSSVDVESPPSAVNMKGYRTNSRGHQSSAIMVETAPTQRSSSQPSVDTESRPSAVIIQGNRSSSRGHQSGTIKQSALTLRSLSQDSVNIESHPSAVMKRNRSSSRKRQSDAIKGKCADSSLVESR
ncbi:hypothetical protein KIN20_032651 [Parelaphostrongylus tenuis]|uniref:Uncharacterized protein n=1 Tax=Parelaphostrongylus tenuis TaxID=148309 RepID=A0AAD5WHU8_PARTN|nr:hypothetical protein KIN20_032651 [Parelaphostrongylus tenuis]